MLRGSRRPQQDRGSRMTDVEALPLQSEERFHALQGVATELRAVLREPRGFVAVAILLVVLSFAFILPVFDSTDPNWPGDGPKNGDISWDNPMGTDHLARDLLAPQLGRPRAHDQAWLHRRPHRLARRHHRRLHRRMARG